MTEKNHEKNPVRLIGTGIWTQDLPNASLVRYHRAISLSSWILVNFSTEVFHKTMKIMICVIAILSNGLSFA